MQFIMQRMTQTVSLKSHKNIAVLGHMKFDMISQCSRLSNKRTVLNKCFQGRARRCSCLYVFYQMYVLMLSLIKAYRRGESLKKNKHTGLFIQELRVSEQNTLCDDKEKKFFFSKKHG